MSAGLIIDIKDFYLLPRSRRKKYYELAIIVKKEKLKEQMNLVSLALNGTLAFKPDSDDDYND